MTLSSAGNDVMGGVYVGPYTGTVNGVSTPVICDDFVNDSYAPEEWTAYVYSTPNSSTQEAANSGFTGAALTQAYNEVGYLANLLLAQSDPVITGEVDFALWSVFDPSAINNLSGSQYTAALGYLNTAKTYANNSSYISEFTIYSPDVAAPITCGGGPCPASPPQEFLVRTPEPASLATLGCDFAGVGLLCFWSLRKRARKA
jgi:hypothetical protein